MNIDNLIITLNQDADQIASYCKTLTSPEIKVITLDIFVIGSGQRTIYLIDGFLDSILKGNFVCTAPIIRMNLDTLLRIIFIMKHGTEEILSQFVEGKAFRNIKDQDGRKLTDQRLREYARPHYKWIDPVYEQTSDFVHLSSRHFYSHVTIVNSDISNIHFRYGRPAIEWMKKEDVFEHCAAMQTISSNVKIMIEKYIKHRPNIHLGRPIA
ncbi:hypothetical protein F9K33_12050 [bacterium]|nr:MAG: hypothetical protein F9K33_12050 [bacterium]